MEPGPSPDDRRCAGRRRTAWRTFHGDRHAGADPFARRVAALPLAHPVPPRLHARDATGEGCFVASYWQAARREVVLAFDDVSDAST